MLSPFSDVIPCARAGATVYGHFCKNAERKHMCLNKYDIVGDGRLALPVNRPYFRVWGGCGKRDRNTVVQVGLTLIPVPMEPPERVSSSS